MCFGGLDETDYVPTGKLFSKAFDEVWLSKGQDILALPFSGHRECGACAEPLPYPAQACGALRAGWTGARRSGAAGSVAAPKVKANA